LRWRPFKPPEGFLYVMYVPELQACKVGITTWRPELRALELSSSTGYRHHAVYAAWVGKPARWEKDIQRALAKHRLHLPWRDLQREGKRLPPAFEYFRCKWLR
jgi:hypothetical protein